MTIMSKHARQAGLLATAVLAIAALSACSTSGGTPVSQQAGDPTKLTIGFGSDPASAGYDPAKYSGEGQLQFLEGFYESLFIRSSDGAPKPGLATSFSYNSDKTVMTLVLKSGVSFADGSILDASLVKANLDRRTDSSLVAFSTIKPGGDDEIASVDVVSPNTVALKFTAPHANFEGELDGTAGMMIGKSAIADLSTLSKAPDGSGPYTLDTGATVVGSSYSMVKNDKSDVSAAFPFKTIVFKPILDPQARVNALVSGQVDTAPINSTSSDLARSKGLSIASTGGTIMTMITFDKLGTIVPAFGSEKVRQAIQMAIDRKGLVEALHKGDEPTWNALPISSPGFDKSLEEKFAYNPDKAKSLLKEAGYGDGFSFDIVIQPETQTDLQAVQKDLAAVGVTMNIKVASSTQEGFDATSTTALGIAPITWASPSGNMSDIFFGFANSQGATDAQLTAAVSAIEEGGSKATEPLKQLNDRLIEAGWDIPLYELVSQPQGYNPAKLKNVADQNGLLSKFLPAT